MRYDAFISYRHADLDMYVAKKIHKGLETFRVPRAVAKASGKKNIKRVFRDQEELPIGSDLGDNIEHALAESEYLLVICSPRTPESYWVQKEISTFISMHGREHVLAILVEGEPDESFPRQLLIDDAGNPVEPLAADVRGLTKKEIDKKIRSELLRLAAPLLSCSYDDLKQRHRERKMKRIAALSALVAIMAVSFGAYSSYNANLIQQNLEGKQTNQSKYLADTALSLYEVGDRRAAVLVALEALPSEENDRPYVAEAQYALSQALGCYDTGNEIQMDLALHHDLPVSDFSYNDAGTRIVSVDQGDNVYVWDVETGELLAQIAPRIDESGYVVEVIGAMVYDEQIIICEDKGVYAVDFVGNELWDTEGNYSYCIFDEENQRVACVYRNQVDFIALTTGEVLATMPNQMEAGYSAAMAFNEDKTKFAVSHLMSEDRATAGYVSVYDFKSGTIMDIETMSTYISDMEFTSDGCLVVAGNLYDELMNWEQSIATGYAEKFNIETAEQLWVNTYECQIVSIDSASTQIKTRKYQDETTGEWIDEVLLSVDSTAYTWDNLTGELSTEVRAGAAITTFLVSKNNCHGYLAESHGTINIMDMTLGKNYSNAAIETGKELSDIAIKNGVLAMRAYASPDITLMKYHEGYGMQQLKEYDSSVKEIKHSKDGNFYAVALYTDNLREEIHFYRAEDNEEIGSWSGPEDGYLLFGTYADDVTYVLIDSEGVITYLDMKNSEKNEMTTGDWMGTVDCYVEDTQSYAFLYDGRQYMVLNLATREIIAEAEIDNYIYGGIISRDGTKIYACLQERGVCRIDVHTGEITSIDRDGYQVLSGSNAKEAFVLSPDGNLLAVSCLDGVLRILDTEMMETVHEIPFAGRNRRFMMFSEDSRSLLLQGDDYYFRVYDLNEAEFCHVSADQYDEIQQITVDEETGTICLVTTSDMLILNDADYERVAQVEDGKAYLPQTSKVLCSSVGTLYEFPYMTLEMLKEEAVRQFGEDSLSDLEKIRYHVD